MDQKADNTTIVYSDFKHLAWYHFVVIVAQSLMVIFVTFLVALLCLYPRQFHDARVVPLFFVLTMIWYRSAYSMIRKREVVRYNEKGIQGLQNATLTMGHEVRYSEVQEVIRNSETCLTLKFKNRIPLNISPAATANPKNFSVQEFQFEANEDGLNGFCHYLSKEKVPVSEDSIPDNDPIKETGVLIVSMIGVFALMVFGIWFAIKGSKIH